MEVNSGNPYHVLNRLIKYKKRQNKTESSTLFHRGFVNRLMRQIYAKNRVDNLIMDIPTLCEMEVPVVAMTAEKPAKSRVFEMEAAMTNGVRACFTCTNSVCLENELMIPH